MFDYRLNKTGNIGFTISNYGHLGYYDEQNKSSVVYPKGSKSSYIFGSGFYLTGKSNSRPFLIKNYDIQTARSQFVPGRIENGNLLDSSKINSYQIYFSSDYDKKTGTPKFGGDEPNWPIWRSNISQLSKYLGDYEIENSKRSNNNNYIEPAIISDDDIFITYKNSDLSAYDNKILDYKSLNLPIIIQVEELINTWSISELKDCAILNYKIINKSLDTLIDCYFVPSFDIHITNTNNPFFGNDNDNAKIVKFILSNSTFSIGVFWSDSSNYEVGHSQNYLAIGLINSPKVDLKGFVINTNNNISIEEISKNKSPIFIDPDADYLNNPSKFYKKIKSNDVLLDKMKTNIKTLFPSNQFSLMPNDTVRFSVLICFAKPFGKTLPSGEAAEMVKLNTNIKNALDNFYKGFEYLSLNDITDKRNYKQINNELYIKTNADKLIIYDVIGKEYLLSSQSENDEYKIFSLEILPKGMYFVTIDKMNIKVFKD